MNRHPRNGRIVALSLVLLAGLDVTIAQAQGRRSNRPRDRFDEIIERLTRIEAELDTPSASATFCISQGRGLDITGTWAAETGAEVNLGAGWPNVAWAKAVGQVKIPIVLPGTPIPLPTELSLELGGEHGRNFDICVELPVELSPGDQAQLQAVSATMNDAANLGETFQTKGKFQKRAARAINYACRKVGGLLECPILPNLPLATFSQANVEADAEQELDRADTASENLLEGGFGAVEEGLQAFNEGNVSELLASLELPADVRSVMSDPERIFEGLPDLSAGVPNCESLRITAGMRARRPVLDRLCAELSGLPDDRVVKGAFDKIHELSDEVVDAIAEIVRPLLSNAGEVSQNTRARFCSSIIGQRPVFNRYCGR
jgi:hypothetical protein